MDVPIVASAPPDAYVRALIDVLHEATDSAGMSQEQVGAVMGLSQQTVSRLWAHRRSIDVQEVFLLASALNLEASALIKAAQDRVQDAEPVNLEREAALRRREHLLLQLREERLKARRARAGRHATHQAG